ncbi:MAG: 4Fe-4S binding protein [Paludibacter sp.]|nr:4Fe-4S binding protein [Paludibacter sp.]
MLRKIRIVVSLSIFVLTTIYFLDFSGIIPHQLHAITHLQFIPALLGLHTGVIIALILITFVFGRVYCSSVCPLGVYQDIITWFSKKIRKTKRFKFSPALNILRWSVIVVTLIAFLFGFTFLLGLLDPYSAFGRMTVHIFKPAYLAGNNLLETIFTQFNNHTFYKVSIYILSVSTLIIALITLLSVSTLAWVNGRIYCNTICPVGTVLGFVSRVSILKIRIDNDLCNSCGTCGRKCKASCIDTKSRQIDYSRCINCFDCIEVCSQDAVKFRYAKSITNTNTPKVVNESKRRFMIALGVTTLAAGKALADKTLLNSSLKNKAIRETPISPPGSKSHEHLLGKCTSCHLCVSKCPSGVIKPAFAEYGLGGIMQPMLNFDKGFCNYDCTICSEICPTGAIQPLTIEQKHITQTGEVHFIKENCIVYTDETFCGACSEHCPTQAVSMVPYKNGLTIPYTETSICVGCGGCEYVGPSKPCKAIFVEGILSHKNIVITHDKKDESIKVDDFGF